MPISMNKARAIGLAAAAMIASLGAAAAQENYAQRPAQHNVITENRANQGLALSRWDRARFDRSGTRGREGLGATPLRPEGPGNVAD